MRVIRSSLIGFVFVSAVACGGSSSKDGSRTAQPHDAGVGSLAEDRGGEPEPDSRMDEGEQAVDDSNDVLGTENEDQTVDQEETEAGVARPPLGEGGAPKPTATQSSSGVGGAGGSGGGPSSGGHAGGFSVGGVGGSGGQGSRPTDSGIPDGCERLDSTEELAACSLLLQCEGQQFFSRCSKEADEWHCECEGQEHYDYYLSGLEDVGACSYAGTLCGVSPRPDPASEEVCTLVEPSATLESCDQRRSCSKTEDLGNGLTLRTVTNSSDLSCYKLGAEWECACSLGTSIYRLSSPNGSAATCQAMRSVCFEGAEPQYAPEPSCVEASSYDSPDLCQAELLCTRSADLGGGVSAVTTTSSYANCGVYDDEEWQCYCEIDDAQPHSFKFLAQSDGPRRCLDSAAICEDLDEVTPSGTPSCATQDVYTTGDSYCSAVVECWQEATVADFGVALSGSNHVQCALDEETDTWSCTCYGPSTEVYEFSNDQDVWETCNFAAAPCTESVEIGRHYWGNP